MKTTLTIVCTISAMCVVGAAQKPSARKTSISESELRALATAAPTAKNAGQLYSVAMATTNNVERRQELLKAAAACLIACGKNDVYKNHVKGKLQGVVEFENELKDDCKQCSGAGTKDRRCSECNGNGQCSRCKGAGQTTHVGFDRNNTVKTCGKCNGDRRCSKCGGEGSRKEKCVTCAGTGKAFSEVVAARVFRDSCKAIADGKVPEERRWGQQNVTKGSRYARRRESDETYSPEVKAPEERRTGRQNATKERIRRLLRKPFAERCKASGDAAEVIYNGVTYSVLKNTQGEDNFVVLSRGPATKDYAYSFMVFPTRNSRDRWYEAVVECTEKLKSWIRISADKKVEHVTKEIPIRTDVFACGDRIMRGIGDRDLMRKLVCESYALSEDAPVKFIGTVDAGRAFNRYSASIGIKCGNFFSHEIFHMGGTIEDIEDHIAEFLTFVNPESLENARKTQAKKEDLFQ